MSCLIQYRQIFPYPPTAAEPLKFCGIKRVGFKLQRLQTAGLCVQGVPWTFQHSSFRKFFILNSSSLGMNIAKIPEPLCRTLTLFRG